MAKFALIILFACGHGCGQPEQVQVGVYSTLAECNAAGMKWRSANADPQHAIANHRCIQAKGAQR